jgi:hypothetical protein
MAKWISTNVNQYFDHQIIYTETSEQKLLTTQAIKCLIPHGIIPFSGIGLYNLFENDTFVISDILYEFPISKYIVKRLNVMSCSKHNIKTILQNNKSVVIYPGGVREIFSSNELIEYHNVRKRTGLFKLALELNKPLIPIYTFGLTQLYHRSKIELKIPYLFKNKTDTIAWYYGKYNSIYPIYTNFITVVGNYILPTKQDTIESIKQKYITEIKYIFHKYKHLHPLYSNKNIYFV